MSSLQFYRLSLYEINGGGIGNTEYVEFFSACLENVIMFDCTVLLLAQCQWNSFIIWAVESRQSCRKM